MRKVSFILLLLSVFSCAAQEKKTTISATKAEVVRFYFAEPHLGTVVRIVFYADNKDFAEQLAQRCFKRVTKLNAVLSDYSTKSEVSELCSKTIGVAHQVSNELFTVIAKAQTISEKSNGAFDITLGKHTQRWRDRAMLDDSSDSTVSYRDLRLDHNNKTITLLQSLKIDLGGIGKGYIGDQLMLVLKESGVTQAAVIIGGETVLAAAPPEKKGWHIGIEDSQHKVIGKIALENIALSTSGDSFQFFEADGKRQSHLIDPSTKQSKTNRLNVTTIAPTSMEADAWATALRVLPIEKAITIANKEPKLEALFIPHKQNTSSTKNFPTLQLP